VLRAKAYPAKGVEAGKADQVWIASAVARTAEAERLLSPASRRNPMRSAVRRPARTRRLLATVLLLALPLAATTACGEDEGSDDGGVEQEEEDED